jgi:hypothetical protein
MRFKDAATGKRIDMTPLEAIPAWRRLFGAKPCATNIHTPKAAVKDQFA